MLEHRERNNDYRINTARNFLIRNGYTVTKADQERDELRKAVHDGTK